jgi:hypothetical protein
LLFWFFVNNQVDLSNFVPFTLHMDQGVGCLLVTVLAWPNSHKFRLPIYVNMACASKGVLVVSGGDPEAAKINEACTVREVVIDTYMANEKESKVIKLLKIDNDQCKCWARVVCWPTACGLLTQAWQWCSLSRAQPGSVGSQQ